MKAVNQLADHVSIYRGDGFRGGGDVQVGENDVDSEDEFAQGCWQEWGDESREEEDDGEDGLNMLDLCRCRLILGIGWEGGCTMTS